MEKSENVRYLCIKRTASALSGEPERKQDEAETDGYLGNVG